MFGGHSAIRNGAGFPNSHAAEFNHGCRGWPRTRKTFYPRQSLSSVVKLRNPQSAIEWPRAQLLTSKQAAHEGCVSITACNASTYQMSHCETFDNLLSLNGPVEPSPRKSPAGTPDISQGQRPWKAVPIISCVPHGTPELEPNLTNPETSATRGMARLRKNFSPPWLFPSQQRPKSNFSQ